MIERYFFKSWEPDRSDFEQEGLELVENVVPVNGVLREIRRPSELHIVTPGLNFGGKIEGSWPFEVVEAIPSDLQGLYLTSADTVLGTRIWHFNHLGPAYSETDRSKVAGGYGVGSIFRFTQFGAGNVLASAIEEPLQVRAGTHFVDAITSTTKPQGHYITTIRSYLLMGYIKEGGTYYPHRFWWSARNDLANWEPVVDTSGGGWGELNPVGGAITGLVGIEDFGLIWTEFGLHRLDFSGGTNLWERKQIGGREEGKDFFSEPVFLGRDCYYWSRYGPKVVRNGETVEDISGGRVAQFLTDYNRNPYYARDKLTGVDAAVSGIWGIVAFRFKARATGDGGAEQHFVALYNTNTDEWGFMGPVLGTGIEVGSGDITTWEVSLVEMSKARAGDVSLDNPGSWPLDDLGLVWWGDNIEGTTINAGNFARTDVPSYPWGVTSRIYRGIDGERTQMDRIRPMVLFAGVSTGAGPGGTPSSPAPAGVYPQLKVQYTDDAYGYRNLRTLTLPKGSDNQAIIPKFDRNGYWLGDLPILGQSFQFNSQVTEGLTSSQVVSETIGVEVDIKDAGRGG